MSAAQWVQMNAATWIVVGLILVLAGVLVLFRYGMPYQIRTGGWPTWIDDNPPDANQIKLERRYGRLGWIGLVLILGGTVCQIIGALK